MKISTDIRRITRPEFCNLKPGDEVFIRCGESTFKAVVVRPAFYNADADEPDWEIETTNGFCDEYSIYLENK